MGQNWTCSVMSVVLAALLAAGCRQPAPKKSPAARAKPSKGGETVTRPTKPSADGTAANLSPRSTWSSKWSRVGNIRVRIDRVEVRKPAMLSANDTEYEGDNEELVVSLTVESLSKDEPLEYQRWEVGTNTGTNLTDDSGKSYQIRTFSTTKVKGGVKGGKTTMPLDGLPITDVILFERPETGAGELRLTLGPQTGRGKEGHEFRIPATAWKR